MRVLIDHGTEPASRIYYNDGYIIKVFGETAVVQDLTGYPNTVLLTDGFVTTWVRIHDGKWHVTEESSLHITQDMKEFLDGLAVTYKLIQGD